MTWTNAGMVIIGLGIWHELRVIHVGINDLVVALHSAHRKIFPEDAP